MPTAGDIYYFASRGGSPKRPPVVLIHGAGGDHLHWPHNLRRLTGHRVFAPDLPGHGKSQGLGRQTIDGYAKDIAKWLQAINIAKAVFVGHSMGGAIALTLALEHSERVLGLGLIGTGARLRVRGELLERFSHESSFEAGVDLLLSNAYAEGTATKNTARMRQRLLANRPSVIHGDYLACNDFDRMEEVSKIATATCVICGEEDRMTPPKYAEFLAEQIPKAKLEIIPNSGHMVMLEQPEVVAQTLGEFLQTISY